MRSPSATARFLRNLSVAAVGGAVLTASLIAGGQNQPPDGAQSPDARPSFEVASIKPNSSNDGRVGMMIQPGGRLNATNVTLSLLIAQAYRLQGGRGGLSGRANPLIVNAPEWVNTSHFDVVAKAEGDVAPDLVPDLVKSLLVDRFKLAAHSESREFQVYALVPARSDGKLGSGLRAVSAECASTLAARGRVGPPRGDAPGGPGGPGRGPIAPPLPGQPIPCGMIRVGPGNIAAGGAQIAQLVTTLSPWVDRIVIDKTGLTGAYEMELQWTPEQLSRGGGPGSSFGGGVPPPGGAPFPPIDPNGPSIFTAVQEQLGLKLESTRAPVDVIVIDHVEQPSPD
jgi:uncharacterized protein (TIGR03435 family)